MYLRQSTASQVVHFPTFVDSTDGDTPETGLTIANTDIKLAKRNATSLVSKNSGGATHMATGNYYATFDATDTDTLGTLKVYVHPTGALAVYVEMEVLLAQVFDSLILGSDLLQVDTKQVNGTNQTGADVGALATAIDAKTTNLPSDPADASDVAGAISTLSGKVDTVQSGVTGIKAKTDNLPSDPADASDIASAISTVSGKVDTVQTGVTAIKAKTDNLPASPAATGDVPSAGSNAAALLKYDMSTVTGEAARSPLNALRFMRNNRFIDSGVLHVTKEDDSTDAWTATVTTDDAAVPVVGVDPV